MCLLLVIDIEIFSTNLRISVSEKDLRKKERKKVKSLTLWKWKCLTLCDPMDGSPPGSSVHGILQARLLEWVAISFPRGSSWPRDRTQVSHIAGRRFNLWATREGAEKDLRASLIHQLWILIPSVPYSPFCPSINRSVIYWCVTIPKCVFWLRKQSLSSSKFWVLATWIELSEMLLLLVLPRLTHVASVHPAVQPGVDWTCMASSHI